MAGCAIQKGLGTSAMDPQCHGARSSARLSYRPWKILSRCRQRPAEVFLQNSWRPLIFQYMRPLMVILKRSSPERGIPEQLSRDLHEIRARFATTSATCRDCRQVDGFAQALCEAFLADRSRPHHDVKIMKVSRGNYPQVTCFIFIQARSVNYDESW